MPNRVFNQPALLPNAKIDPHVDIGEELFRKSFRQVSGPDPCLSVNKQENCT